MKYRGAKLLLALVALYAFARLTHFLPFPFNTPLWRNNQYFAPAKVSPSEWKFSRPGPLPTECQPYFVAPQGSPTRVSILTPTHPEPRTIYKDMSLRNRAFPLRSWVGEDKEFTLRFEGKEATMDSIRFFVTPKPPSFPWALVILSAVAAWCFARGPKREAAALVVVTCLGFAYRWTPFTTYFSLPMEGDATGYWTLNVWHYWNHPWITHYREPGFIWIAHIARDLLGDSTASLRFLCVLLGTACIPLVAMVARAAGWSFWTGLIAATLLAFNPFARYMSSQGYQLEFFILEILLFTYSWYKKNPLAMGLWGALMCVTRVQSFITVIPLAMLADWKFQWKRNDRLKFYVPVLLLAIPYFIAVHRETGSYLGHLQMHANFYSTIEAQDKGTKVTASEADLKHFLLMGDALIRRSKDLVKGYSAMFLDPRDLYNHILLNSHYARHWNWFLLPFFWVGCVRTLRDKKDRWLIWFLLLFLNALPMLHDLIREPRILFHIQPFVALLVARGALFFVDETTRKKRSTFLNP